MRMRRGILLATAAALLARLGLVAPAAISEPGSPVDASYPWVQPWTTDPSRTWPVAARSRAGAAGRGEAALRLLPDHGHSLGRLRIGDSVIPDDVKMMRILGIRNALIGWAVLFVVRRLLRRRAKRLTARLQTSR